MGITLIILSGKKYGLWTAVELVPELSKRRSMWRCRCVCGRVGVISATDLNGPKHNGCKSCMTRAGIYASRSARGLVRPHAISQHCWRRLIAGAKSRGRTLDVSMSYAQGIFDSQNRKCALSGVPIHFGYQFVAEYNASLDRIDPNLGYVEGNVQWLHKGINMLKNSFGEDEFIAACRRVARHTALRVLRPHGSIGVPDLPTLIAPEAP